jgi:hypothetical protein
VPAAQATRETADPLRGSLAPRGESFACALSSRRFDGCTGRGCARRERPSQFAAAGDRIVAMLRFLRFVLVAALAVTPWVYASCSSSPSAPFSTPAPSAEEVARDTVECADPRSPVCTQDYRPVCGLRDTGIRCVTTPCDSTEWVTYSNPCTACSDSRVARYRSGACDADR